MLTGVSDPGLASLAPTLRPNVGQDASFADSLRRAGRKTGGASEWLSGGAKDARTAAEELVSISFIQPVLASVRQSSMAEAPFAPGIAEQRFGPLLDAEIARKVVKASNFDLVDAVARSLRDARMEARVHGQEDPGTIDTAA